MNVYHLVDPHDHRFASAARRGTWEPDPGPGVCPECGRSRQIRVSPLVIEWQPGSDVVGDFTWPGVNDEVVVTDGVRRAIEDVASVVRFGPVEMVPEDAATRRKNGPRVRLPYAGPPLWDLRPAASVGLDLAASGVRLVRHCGTCSRPVYERPPFKERRLVVDPSTWTGESVFYVREYSGWVFCTEHFKQALEARSFTNVAFALDGALPTSAARVQEH